MMNTLRQLSRILIPRSETSRYYYTNRVKKSNLYSQISPVGNPNISVLPQLQNWLQSGKKVSVAELLRIVHDLRRRKRFHHALEVSKWMSETGVCIFSPTEHAVYLDLIGRVHGFVSAEQYFQSLKEQFKTKQTYGALLNCYVRQRNVEKSLLHFQKMKEMGFASSSLTYNDIMCLYTNTSQHDKVPGVLAEMMQDNVAPDNYSFRICINAYGVMSDIEGMERTLKEMESEPSITMDWNTYAVAAKIHIEAGNADRAAEFLKMSEERLENKDGTGYNHLMSLYAKLGNKNEVLRLWDLEKDACKRRINQDYCTILQSLVKLNEMEAAEEVLKEWESSGNCYDFRVPGIVFHGYAKGGLYDKAEGVLKDQVEKGKGISPNSWGILAEGYSKKGEQDRALRSMKAAISINTQNKKWRPSLKVISSILTWLGDEGGYEDAEGFVALLRTCVDVNVQMYHTLLKANLRAGGGNVDTLLRCMKRDNLDVDEVTKEILINSEET